MKDSSTTCPCPACDDRRSATPDSLQCDSTGRYYLFGYNVPLDTPPKLLGIYPDAATAYAAQLTMLGYRASAKLARIWVQNVNIGPLDTRYFAADGSDVQEVSA